MEVDVQLTKDSVLVLYHDKELQTLTTCVGSVIHYRAADLQMCDYRTDFNSYILQDEDIVTLEEIFEHFAQTREKPDFYLDIKLPERNGQQDTVQYAKIMANAIHALVTRYNLTERVVAESSEVPVLRYLQQLNPGVKVEIDNNNFEEAIELAGRYALNGIVINNKNTSKEQIRQAHKLGLHVTLFDVILRKEIVEAVNKHPDVIQTDNVILLQQILTK